MLFVAAGAPMTSRLFLRVRRGEMPPAIETGIPRPTVSDISVLYEWISRCVAPPDDDMDGGSRDGGPDDDLNDQRARARSTALGTIKSTTGGGQ
jgi:hypothetical protein